MNYSAFLEGKKLRSLDQGFKPLIEHSFLFPFQGHLVNWNLLKGRSGTYAGCGLGKGPMQLAWADNVLRKTNKPVLIVAPLAVSVQFLKEGEKFGIEVHRSRDGKVKKGINVTNYERLSKFDPSALGGVSFDEAGIFKGLDSTTRKQATSFMESIQYRLMATATPSPNDYMELGSQSEALSVMKRSRMLGTFFTKEGKSSHGWFLKGHGKKRFWEWMCSWARFVRKPSDIGFSDDGFVLPELITRQHEVKSPKVGDGFGNMPAITLDEQREERRLTLKERCELAARLTEDRKHSVMWCHLNPEGDLLERITQGAVQVSGRDSDEEKEEKLSAFSDGQIRVLVTKPRIGGFGLNWQHCNHMTLFPSHSFEQAYQCVRRCWRFGQREKVTVDTVTSQRESMVVRNYQRKERQNEELYGSIVAEMRQGIERNGHVNGKEKMRLPAWLLK
jgi:hypothetical protein